MWNNVWRLEEVEDEMDKKSKCVRAQSVAATCIHTRSEVGTGAINSHTSSLFFSTPAAMQKLILKETIVRGELQSMLQSKALGGP